MESNDSIKRHEIVLERQTIHFQLYNRLLVPKFQNPTCLDMQYVSHSYSDLELTDLETDLEAELPL